MRFVKVRRKNVKGECIMTNKDVLGLDLQLFAEDNDNPEVEESQQESKEEPTVTVAEMKRRLKKDQDKYQAQIDELKNNQERLIAEAIEQAQAEANMNAKELEEFKRDKEQKKHQSELEDRDNRIKELLAEKKQRDIKDESYNTLAELGIQANEVTLGLVGSDSLEGMAERAEWLSQYTSQIKSQYSSQEPPITGGGTGRNKDDRSIFDILDAAAQK